MHLAEAIRSFFKRKTMNDNKAVEWTLHPGDLDPGRGEVYTLGLSRRYLLPSHEATLARELIAEVLDETRAAFALRPEWQQERHLSEVIRQTELALAEVEAQAAAAEDRSRTALIT